MTNKSSLPLIAIANFSLKAGGTGLNLLIQLVLARVLSSEDFGIYIIAFSLSTSIMVIASLGIPLSAIKFIPLYRHENQWPMIRGFFGAGALTTLIGGVLFAVIAYTFTHMLVDKASSPTLFSALTIAILSIPFLALSQTLVAYLQSLQHVIAAEFVANIIRPVVTLLGVGASVMFIADIDVTWILWLTLFGIGASVVVGLQQFFHYVPNSIANVKSQFELKPWFAAGISTMVIMGGVILNERIDVMLVGAYSSIEDAGIYGVCARLAFFVGFALTAVNAILGPQLSAILATKDIDKFKKVAVIGAAMAVFAAVTLSLILVLLDSWVLSLFGEHFIDGKPVLHVLLLSQIAVACFGATGAVVVLFGGYRITIGSVITALLCNVLLNLMLIPIYGPVGAALATLIGQFLGCGIITLWCIRHSGINSTIFGIAVLFHSRKPAN